MMRLNRADALSRKLVVEHDFNAEQANGTLIVVDEMVDDGIDRVVTSIESLGSEVNTGFDILGKRIDLVEKRFDTVGERFDVVEKRFDTVGERFDVVEKQFEAVDKRFDVVDKQFEVVDKRFDVVDKQFEAVDKRFDVVDKRFEAVDKRFEAMESDISSMRQWLPVKSAFFIVVVLAAYASADEVIRLITNMLN